MKTFTRETIDKNRDILAADRTARAATRREQSARRKFEKFRNVYHVAADLVKIGARLRVSVSNGNSKMGEIASISLLPLVTCAGGFTCPCAAKCYAAKIAAFRSSVLLAYAKNTAIALHAPAVFWADFRAAIATRAYFRLNVAGDIPSAGFFAELVKAAAEFPHCRILAFTKRAAIVNAWISENGALPENLKIIFSNWGANEQPNPYGLPVSNVIFAGTTPPDNWKICGGNCYNCACRGVGCWELKNGETIAFYEH